jgi:hypothetical protein
MDGPFLEESQITICDNADLCIELGEKTVIVAL